MLGVGATSSPRPQRVAALKNDATSGNETLRSSDRMQPFLGRARALLTAHTKMLEVRLNEVEQRQYEIAYSKEVAFNSNLRWARKISPSEKKAFHAVKVRREEAEGMRPSTPRNWHGKKWGADAAAAAEEERSSREAARKQAQAEQEEKIQESAATQIQLAFRTSVARWELRQHKSASRIQCIYRMFSSRRRIEQIQEEALRRGISAREAAMSSQQKASNLETAEIDALEESHAQDNLLNPQGPAQEDMLHLQEIPLEAIPFAQRFENGCVNRSVLPLLNRRDMDLLNLNLKHYGLGHETTLALAEALQSLEAQGLRTLNLQGNRLRGEAVARIVEALEDKVNLESLNLSGNILGPPYSKHDEDIAIVDAQKEVMANMPDGFEKSCVRKAVLKREELMRTKLRSMCGVDRLCLVVRHASMLRTLILRGNKIGDGGVKALLNEVPASNIEHLDLSDNNISPSADANVCDLIMMSPHLETLDLSSNRLSLLPVIDPNELHNPPQLSEALAVRENKLTTLRLAWNRLGQEGAYQLATGLLHNEELLTLDVQHNGINERGGCVLVDAIIRNQTLERVNLDSNPLGIAGCAEMLRLLQEKDADKLRISVKACGWMVQDRTLVDFDVPALPPETGVTLERVTTDANGDETKTVVRRYRFQLSRPYDRFAAHRLADIAFCEPVPGEAWIQVTLQDKKFILPDAEPEPNDDWLPCDGVLEFDFKASAATSKVEEGVRHKRRRQLLHIMMKRHQEGQGRDRSDYQDKKTLTSEQAAEMLAQAMKLKRVDKRLKTISQLYVKIVDHEHDELFTNRLKAEDLHALQEMLGPMFAFNARNATGRYVLDLSNPWHQLVACRLTELSAAEKQRQIHLKLKDLSQNGNQQCWRNESYDNVPFQFSPSSFPIPTTGVLELDYATFVRPPKKATPLEEEVFERLRDQLREQLSARGEESAIIWLRKKSLLFYLEATQMAEMFNVFPSAEYRADAFVLLWPRLVDEENSNIVLQFFDPAENQKLRQRLGHLALFNPIRPDGPYKLDLADHEQASVAKLLLLLSIREPGQNILKEHYNGESFEIPKQWLTDLPTEGVLKLEYFTESEENAVMDLRRSLAEQVLGWSFAD